MPENHYDVIIIGAGAAGLMCACEAASHSRSVLVLEHSPHIGEKIRISGGGRCNFTNIHASPKNYLSENPHFCTSALSRYTPQHFIQLVEKHKITYHEKTLGQLFCDGSSQQIIDMLLKECQQYGVTIRTQIQIKTIAKEGKFTLQTSQGEFSCVALVIATGGLSIPKLGASGFGYDIARQFGLNITQVKPALVPFTMNDTFFTKLSGVSAPASVTSNKVTFKESILFTHRGLSGPAILQASSYWEEEEPITINLLPDVDLYSVLKEGQQGKVLFSTVLNRYLPKRFVQLWCETMIPASKAQKALAEYKAKELEQLAHTLHHWEIIPAGTEGYAKAEVTVGGIDTNELSSKTMEAKKVPGLYFIGEVVDVTGWLGGYNFQWAWASAVAAGKAIRTLSVC